MKTEQQTETGSLIGLYRCQYILLFSSNSILTITIFFLIIKWKKYMILERMWERKDILLLKFILTCLSCNLCFVLLSVLCICVAIYITIIEKRKKFTNLIQQKIPQPYLSDQDILFGLFDHTMKKQQQTGTDTLASCLSASISIDFDLGKHFSPSYFNFICIL